MSAARCQVRAPSRWVVAGVGALLPRDPLRPTTAPDDPSRFERLPNDARPTTMPQTATSVPRDRASLARELQGELKRVGCYGSEINGVWTTSTRQAMKAFADRVNATLPVDEPDIILLTLVRAYQDKVCGKPCPAGQSLVDEDRCVPNALMAQPIASIRSALALSMVVGSSAP